MTDGDARRLKFRRIIQAYPLALIALAAGLTFLIGLAPAPAGFGVTPALILCGALIALNHTWLMTATELTRLRHGLHASPEEWAAAGAQKADVPELAWTALERRHNAHRNATENTVVFAVMAIAVIAADPPGLAAPVWMLAFGTGRLGYTFAALAGHTGARGLFMSLSLLGLYGLLVSLVLSLTG